MTAIMLALLIALGTWQIYRLHWKQGLLAAIAASERGPAVPLSAHPAPWAKVSVTGRFVPDASARYGTDVRDTPSGPALGSFDIAVLRRSDRRAVLVERGWLPESASAPEPAGTVTVEGYVRPGERAGWLSAVDDPATRHFYTLDPARIGAVLGARDVEPFVVVALGRDVPGVYPEPAEHLPQPPNNHLQYVITWYGLAVALLVTFILWARGTVRA